MDHIATRLYAVREISDVFVDAAIRDDAGDLLFCSLFGRDTAIQQLFASLTLSPAHGGRDAFTLVLDDESHLVTVSDPDALQKLTGRLPRGNLFGNLTHVWLYQAEAIQPDRVNRRALLLRYAESEEAFANRVWLLIRELCPVPLLDHWREPLLAALGTELIRPLSAGNAPPIGVVDGAHLALPADFEQVISAAVAGQALTLRAEDLPEDAAVRVERAVKAVRTATPIENAAHAAEAGDRVDGSASPTPLFDLGKLVCTPGVHELVESGVVRLAPLLARHMRGDWGVVSDPHVNTQALKNGERILSAYPIDVSQPCKGFGDNTIWIITEWDRSVTTCLFPDEY